MKIANRDAADFWCPMARAGAPLQTEDEVDEMLPPGGARCVGACCAAWRWWNPASDDGTESSLDGYCGMAGKPSYAP